MAGIKTKAVEKGRQGNLALTTEAGSMWSPVCWLVGFEATGFCQEAYCDSWLVSLPASQRKPGQFSWSSSHARGGVGSVQKGHTASTGCGNTAKRQASFLLTHALWVSFCSIWTVLQKSWDITLDSQQRGNQGEQADAEGRRWCLTQRGSGAARGLVSAAAV